MTSPSSVCESVMILLGSNLEPELNLKAAVRLLRESLGPMKCSPIYETAAVGAPETPPFWNAAVLTATILAPRSLKFDVLRPIESQLGRRREEDRNAPRTVDLDIGLYGARVINDVENGLCIPDPELVMRPHMALPLADLAPRRRHPVNGLRLAAIARRFRRCPQGWRRLPVHLD